MKIESVLGAFIAALILFFTGALALLTQPEVVSVGDISPLAWIVLSIGALIALLKDFQAITTRRGLEKLTGSGNVH